MEGKDGNCISRIIGWRGRKQNVDAKLLDREEVRGI